MELSQVEQKFKTLVKICPEPNTYHSYTLWGKRLWGGGTSTRKLRLVSQDSALPFSQLIVDWNVWYSDWMALLCHSVTFQAQFSSLNDTCTVSSYVCMKRFQFIETNYEHSRVIWSCMLPRMNWCCSKNASAMESSFLSTQTGLAVWQSNYLPSSLWLLFSVTEWNCPN